MQHRLGRGIGFILVVGVALGLAHNGLGLVSRPPRGIPWVAASVMLPTIESPDAPSPTAAPSPAAGTSDAPASSSSPPRATAPAPSPRPASGALPASGSAPSSAPTPAGAAPATAPEVPERDHPAQVDVAMAKQLFDARTALFVDARDAAEYEAGHIPGAVRLTRNDALAEPARLETLAERGRPIVAYCEGGTCEASVDLARLLVESGFRRVLVFPGGFPEWQAAGHPVARGSGAP